MEEVNWHKSVDLITMETEGSNCFNAALKEGKIVTLDGINSIAKSLGALSVSSKLFEMSFKNPKIKSLTVTDQEALSSCFKFANDHRILVEPACGAALASVYFKKFESKTKPVILVVCGGNMASLELFESWQNSLN